MGHCVLGALAPGSRFQFGSRAPQVQQSISGVACGPSLSATAKPRAAAQVAAPLPARAAFSSSEAAARSPRRLRAPSPPAAEFLLPPLLRSPSTSRPLPSCFLQSSPGPPRVSRCREVSGGWGKSGSRGDRSGACGSQPLPPPAGRLKRPHAALGARSWREAVPA